MAHADVLPGVGEEGGLAGCRVGNIQRPEFFRGATAPAATLQADVCKDNGDMKVTPAPLKAASEFAINEAATQVLDKLQQVREQLKSTVEGV